jgi:hypothetical protein
MKNKCQLIIFLILIIQISNIYSSTTYKVNIRNEFMKKKNMSYLTKYKESILPNSPFSGFTYENQGETSDSGVLTDIDTDSFLFDTIFMKYNMAMSNNPIFNGTEKRDTRELTSMTYEYYTERPIARLKITCHMPNVSRLMFSYKWTKLILYLAFGNDSKIIGTWVWVSYMYNMKPEKYDAMIVGTVYNVPVGSHKISVFAKTAYHNNQSPWINYEPLASYSLEGEYLDDKKKNKSKSLFVPEKETGPKRRQARTIYSITNGYFLRHLSFLPHISTPYNKPDVLKIANTYVTSGDNMSFYYHGHPVNNQKHGIRAAVGYIDEDGWLATNLTGRDEWNYSKGYVGGKLAYENAVTFSDQGWLNENRLYYGLGQAYWITKRKDTNNSCVTFMQTILKKNTLGSAIYFEPNRFCHEVKVNEKKFKFRRVRAGNLNYVSEKEDIKAPLKSGDVISFKVEDPRKNSGVMAVVNYRNKAGDIVIVSGHNLLTCGEKKDEERNVVKINKDYKKRGMLSNLFPYSKVYVGLKGKRFSICTMKLP